MHAHRLFMSLALAVLLCGATLSADRVKLRSGQTVEGTVTSQDATMVRLTLANGRRAQFPMTDVASIEFTPRKEPDPPPSPASRPAPVTVPAQTVLSVGSVWRLVSVYRETSAATRHLVATGIADHKAPFHAARCVADTWGSWLCHATTHGRSGSGPALSDKEPHAIRDNAGRREALEPATSGVTSEVTSSSSTSDLQADVR
jgi:hypothetical protein